MLQFEHVNKEVTETTAELKRIHAPAGNRDHESLKVFHEEQKKGLAQKGTDDGLKNLPSQRDESQSVEKELNAAYASQYFLLMQQELNLIARLRDLFDMLLKQFLGTAEGQLRKNIRDYETGFEYAKISHKRPGGNTNGSHFLLRYPWAVYILTIFLGILELPLNYTVFQAFKLNRSQTFLAATLLVLLVPICSHFTGRTLKRWREKSANQIWCMVLSGILLLFSIFICLFRFIYYQAKDMNMEDMAAALKLVRTSSAFSDTGFYLTLFFNILLIAVGIILGYTSHDSSQEFETHYKDFNFSRKKLQQHLEGIQKDNEIQIKLNKTESLEHYYIHFLSTLCQQHNELKIFVQTFSFTANQYYKEALFSYRDHNQTNRTTPGPTYWLNEPELPVEVDKIVEKIELVY